MEYSSRKSPRIPNYDYTSCNYYFITICTHDKKRIFGLPDKLNRYGKIAFDNIARIEENYSSVRVDKFVIMPNHVHMILALEEESGNPDVCLLVALYKTGVTKQIRKIHPGMRIWQRSFHDHIIRNQVGYEKIWSYIEYNPIKWEEDCFWQGD